MNKAKDFLLAVAVAAMAFTVSCSGDDGLGEVSSSSEATPSSSSDAPSSSSSLGSSSSLAVVSACGADFRTVTIGTQVWAAENLNCDVEGSKCYDDDPANCATYGRLYNWATAMNLPSSCDENTCSSQIGSSHKGICPSGWHIPSGADWDVLMDYVGGYETAGKHLKATSGWYDCGPSGSGSSYVCEDAHGFSALPGGYGSSDGSVGSVGNDGRWWSASEYNSNYAYGRSMNYDREYALWGYSFKSNLFSVRCLQD